MRDKIAAKLCELDEWGESWGEIKANPLPKYRSAVLGYYRRADAILALEVEGKYTYSPACCESKGDVDACFQHREPSDKCKGCFYYFVNRRPATIAGLVGGE